MRFLFIADYATAFHADNALAHRLDQLRIMRGQDDGRAEVIDLLQYLDDFIGIARVKVAGWLVSQQDFRLIDDGASDGQTLLLTP